MNTATISPETTVGELVRAEPARARIFENLAIDYCCGGRKSLAEACQAKGLDAATVCSMLAALNGGPEGSAVDADAMTLAALCDHIEQVHHGFLRQEMPRWDLMTRKVAAVHGDHEPRLHEIRRVFELFRAEMLAHMKVEEEEAFPAIRRLKDDQAGKDETFADLKGTLSRLESEHDQAGAALAKFKELTDHYTPPDWACNTFRALYEGLEQLEENMHQHVHKENNVLFPRVLGITRQELPNQ